MSLVLEQVTTCEKKTQANWRIKVALVMFVFSFGWGVVSPVMPVLGFPGAAIVTFYAIVGDVMLLVSLFLLGGDFWEKLRSLFVHGAYAVMPIEEVTTHDSAY